MENIGLFLVLLGSLLLLSEGPVLLLTLDGKRNPNLCVHLSCDTEASAETSETNFFKPNGSRKTHKAKLAPSVRDSK